MPGEHYFFHVQNPLVSVIMPARNAEPFIGEAIRSVISQSWENWELLIIENGSTDQTAAIALSFDHRAITVLRSKATGLSEARNEGMDRARGDFICFLDADDRLPSNSLKSRVELLTENPELSFADGVVVNWDRNFVNQIRRWAPRFNGNPHREMARLNPRCFCGITWMIRRTPEATLNFNPEWGHLEDRLFFMSISKSGLYGSVPEEVYHIRRGHTSLMSDHERMEAAFVRFLALARERHLLTDREFGKEMRALRMMWIKTYLRSSNLSAAFRQATSYLLSR